MIRQQIISSILDNLKRIKMENGFYSNAGNNVFEWMEKTLEDRDFPALIVRDPSSKINFESTHEHVLKIEIDVATKGRNSIWNMREVTSDVLKVFGELENILNNRIEYLGFETLVEQRESIYSGTRMEFQISYFSRRFEQ